MGASNTGDASVSGPIFSGNASLREDEVVDSWFKGGGNDSGAWLKVKEKFVHHIRDAFNLEC